jgi:hypothetical protein
MLCGGHSEAKPMNDEHREICLSMKAKVEATMGTQFAEFEPVSYTSQVVAGTNFTFKVRVGAEQHISVKIFRPLPCNGTELELTAAAALN